VKPTSGTPPTATLVVRNDLVSDGDPPDMVSLCNGSKENNLRKSYIHGRLINFQYDKIISILIDKYDRKIQETV
jgi:hypothetical protein